MREPNPEHAERIMDIINNAPYFQHLSMTIHEIGVGYSSFEINLSNKHWHPFDAVHGGVIASIIDSAASWALYYGIEDENAGLTTVDLKLNFLAPAVSGKLLAGGRQINIGKTLGYADCNVTDESDRLVAHGTVTILIFSKNTLESHSLPSKFLD
jgi:uncharacterized protein (TIGR00369 family)